MQFEELVERILLENNVAGGSSSVLGPNVGKTATVVSGDNLANEDGRNITGLYGGVMTRGGMKSYGKKKKKKKQ